VKIENKIAIGCIVQWYEVEIVGFYIESLLQAIEGVDNKENVIVDVCFYMSENFEPIDEKQMKMSEVWNRFRGLEKSLIESGVTCNIEYYTSDERYTISNYRRDFNDKYCEITDVLMWGETDALIPRQTFQIIDMLHTNNISQNTFKWVAFFGTCKMWDESWLPIEHNEFTNKPFKEIGNNVELNDWWSLRYNMTLDEMNKFNDKVDELDVRIVNPYKFNGCGLIISSDVVKSGVNIPRSMLMVHEDTAFQNALIRTFNGSIPQFVIKNILLVHNRKHPKKRMYVQGEDVNEINPGEKRKSNDWYQKVWDADHHHYHTMYSQNKIYKWGDIFDE
tara:strand:+ start:3783 stop:4784 length:1002 start_codon:yes stop_codon:yes gene_type:complete